MTAEKKPRQRRTRAEIEAREERFWERVWDEHKRLNLPPWTLVTPLYTQGLRCPPDEPDKQRWEEARRQFHALVARDPDYYSDCL